MAVENVATELQTVGQYDLVAKIADGGMGTVYKARQRVTGDTVAVKLLPRHLAANPVFLKRFEQEYIAAKALNHPNIVKALEQGNAEDGTPYLVMEFVEGQSVGQRLEHVGRFNEQDAIRIIGQVSQALHKAHKQGLIHRDIKPDNILLTPEGVVKIVDLGLVKEVDADLNLTRTNRGLGTPHFMAPEQFRNAKNADARCDIYSMAATLYMMVTGDLPFASCGPLDAWMKKINNDIVPPRTLAPWISERVDWAIRRSMSPEAAKRAGTCREFLEDLTGRSTRQMTDTDLTGENGDSWYMVYKDDDAVVHTVKGTMTGIRRSLKEGMLGDASNIRVSRTKDGPFEALRNHPEFRDLAVAPAKVPPVVSIARTPTPPTLNILAPTPEPVATEAPTPIPLPAPEPSVSTSQIILPNIYMGPVAQRSGWSRWIILTIVALAAGTIGFFLMPMLKFFEIL
ncbi:MAG: protein kinase [Gemmataceae bacterium]|nr:protein kinase [Gemmataceae bacterium]MCI0741230.1 protein kinase [Gemmataceae bacterium]